LHAYAHFFINAKRMKMKPFETPGIVQKLGIELESGILSNSLVNDLTVRSTGQKVEEYDFSKGNEKNFNFEWK